jgi:hypothetical protein
MAPTGRRRHLDFEGTVISPVEVILRFVVTRFFKLKPEERVQFFQELGEVYCRHCGEPQPATGKCNCEHDV